MTTKVQAYPLDYWIEKRFDGNILKLSERSGLSRFTIYKIKSGESVPLMSTVNKLCRALEIKRGQLALPVYGEEDANAAD